MADIIIKKVKEKPFKRMYEKRFGDFLFLYCKSLEGNIPFWLGMIFFDNCALDIKLYQYASTARRNVRAHAREMLREQKHQFYDAVKETVMSGRRDIWKV